MSVDIDGLQNDEALQQQDQPIYQRPRIQSFINTYGSIPPTQSKFQNLKQMVKNYFSTITCLGILNSFFDFIPIVRCVKEYKVRQYLLADITSGITVGIMNVPQGVAYGALAGLSASNGLYVSFIPPLVYMIFGTCPHISIGTFAIISLLTVQTLDSVSLDSSTSIQQNATSITTNMTTADLFDARLGTATTLAFFVGAIQLALSVFRLGFITTYLTEPFINGLNVGAAVQVFSSQMPSTFGVSNPNDIQGLFKLPRFYVRVIGYIVHNINWISLAITISTIIVLLVVKYFNERYKSKIKIVIPIELILVILATVISHFTKLHDKYKVPIVGPLKRGLPQPVAPTFTNIPSLLVSAATIAAVSICLNISVSKVFSRKHGYKVSSNQELLAYGMGNIVGSFFQCFPSSGSLSRSVIQEESGGKTALVNGVSGIILAVVLLVLAPFLESLPNACLAGIIIVNLKGLLFQVTNLVYYFRISKVEGLLWLITFVVVVLSDVNYGVYVGIAVSFFMNTARTQRPRFTVLGRVGDTHVFKSIKVFPSAEQHPRIKVLRFDGSLYACNAPFFKRKLYDLIGIRLGEKPLITCGEDKRVESEDTTDKYVVLDCSPMNFIDSVGVKLLIEIYKDLKKRHISLYLSECRYDVRETLDAMKFYESTSDRIIYVSTYDAAMSIRGEIEKKLDTETASRWQTTYF